MAAIQIAELALNALPGGGIEALLNAAEVDCCWAADCIPVAVELDDCPMPRSLAAWANVSTGCDCVGGLAPVNRLIHD